jgi:hypothetical protein
LIDFWNCLFEYCSNRANTDPRVMGIFNFKAVDLSAALMNLQHTRLQAVARATPAAAATPVEPTGANATYPPEGC